MTRDEAYRLYGEAAWGMPQDAMGNVIAPSAGTVGAGPYDARPMNGAYDRWLAQGNTPGSGGTMPLDVWMDWQGPQAGFKADGSPVGGSLARLDPATGMVNYELKDDAGLFGTFKEFAEVPAIFGGAILGAGALNGFLGAGTAGEIAALTGSGGAGGAGVGGFGGFGGLGFDAPWGVNPGGGMDYSDFLSEFGFSPDTLPSLPELGPVTNMQNYITKMDSTPAGKDFLNKMIGGASDAAGSTGILSQLLGSNTGASVLTKLLPSLLGVAGSSAQNKALEELVGTQGANRDALLAFGAPYRQRLAGLYDNPSAYLNSPEVQVPVQQATNAMARALSTQGNPIGNGTALQEMQNYSANQLFGRLGQEKDRLAGFGGLTQYNTAGAQQFGNTQAQQAVAQGQGNMWNSLGYGLNQVLNPQPTMADLARQFGFGIQGLA